MGGGGRASVHLEEPILFSLTIWPDYSWCYCERFTSPPHSESLFFVCFFLCVCLFFPSLRCYPFIHLDWQEQLELKGLSVIRKLFKLLQIKNNTYQSQHVPFLSKKWHNFDRKTAFHKISFCGHWVLFLFGKFP